MQWGCCQAQQVHCQGWLPAAAVLRALQGSAEGSVAVSSGQGSSQGGCCGSAGSSGRGGSSAAPAPLRQLQGQGGGGEGSCSSQGGGAVGQAGQQAGGALAQAGLAQQQPSAPGHCRDASGCCAAGQGGGAGGGEAGQGTAAAGVGAAAAAELLPASLPQHPRQHSCSAQPGILPAPSASPVRCSCLSCLLLLPLFHTRPQQQQLCHNAQGAGAGAQQGAAVGGGSSEGLQGQSQGCAQCQLALAQGGWAGSAALPAPRAQAVQQHSQGALRQALGDVVGQGAGSSEQLRQLRGCTAAVLRVSAWQPPLQHALQLPQQLPAQGHC